ncbi:WD-REPEATS-REGION domain-containing protein [Mycena sanguinolenta]|uniref:WD-REPEATS-REGION domain-containing protein n=1 Tax=Mycena sanguinolenta TaxID=230812 RepID=A0A8H6Z564_9AGAR|nr:WD-REPEATS-REGION domain-containing protein [Mycena sanguinolenta]
MRAQRNEKLTLGYMRDHQPFDILPEEYFACAMPDRAEPPSFLYGFAVPFRGTFTASMEILRDMQRKIPAKYDWSDRKKYKSIDAICRYVESRIEGDIEFRVRQSLVDCNPDTLFIFYIYNSWMPRQPKAPEWLFELAGKVTQVFGDLGWKAPEPKWYIDNYMRAYDDSLDFN